MKKNIQEQTVDLDVVTAREIENSTSNTNTNTSKIDTQPKLANYLKNLPTQIAADNNVNTDVYSPFKADGQWGNKSKNLTKILKVIIDEKPRNGIVTSKFISGLKNLTVK